MHIGYLICPNGLGHLRRSIAVINKIAGNREIKLTLFICPNKYSYDLLNFIVDKFENISFERIEMPHPGYSKNNINYNSLIKKFKNKLKSFDLIISDNLVYPLIEVFDKHIFFVSQFFWHNIFENIQYKNKEKELIAMEVDYLKNQTYKILGNKLFSLDDIRSSDYYVPIDHIKNPLFSEVNPKITKEYLLITDGTTSASLSYLNSILTDIGDFCKKNSLKIFLSPRLDSKKILADYEVFDYSQNSFEKVFAAVCRPGLGIITDLLYFSAVPIPIFSENNKELFYNKKVLDDLYSFKSENVINLISYCLNNQSKLLDISKKQKFLGENQILEFILNN